MCNPADYDLLLASWNEIADQLNELNVLKAENERLKAENIDLSGRLQSSTIDRDGWKGQSENLRPEDAMRLTLVVVFAICVISGFVAFMIIMLSKFYTILM